jgi:hypothetical protein
VAPVRGVLSCYNPLGILYEEADLGGAGGERRVGRGGGGERGGGWQKRGMGANVGAGWRDGGNGESGRWDGR